MWLRLYEFLDVKIMKKPSLLAKDVKNVLWHLDEVFETQLL